MLRVILCLAVGASAYAPTGLKLPRVHDIAAGCVATRSCFANSRKWLCKQCP